MYLTCFKDSLPILSDSYQVIFASKLSYGCWHKALPYDTAKVSAPFSHVATGPASYLYRISATAVRSSSPMFFRLWPSPSSTKVTSPGPTITGVPLSLYSPFPLRMQ